MHATSARQNDPLVIFAHELREPLASILLAAQAVSESVPAEGTLTTLRDLSETIQRQSQYLARLIDSALRTGSRDKPCVCLHKEWCHLQPTVLHALETIAPAMRRRGHHLDVSMAPAPIYLLADPLRLQQVLINLLANATKYTPPGGSIWLSVADTAEHVTIKVRDNGIGIAPALLPRVFDLFERGAQAPCEEYTGLGVGLALVKTVVEGHGGCVTAHSEGSNCGATFVMMLPSFAADGRGTPGPPAAQNHGHAPISDPPGQSAMLDA